MNQRFLCDFAFDTEIVSTVQIRSDNINKCLSYESLNSGLYEDENGFALHSSAHRLLCGTGL